MSSDLIEAARNHPKFAELTASRGRFSKILAFLILSVFAVFLGTVALAPEVIARPVAAGWMTTLGVVFSLAMIVAVLAGAAIYVRRANGEFDDLIREILADIKS